MKRNETVTPESAPQVEQDLTTVNSDVLDEATRQSTISARKAATRAHHQLSE